MIMKKFKKELDAIVDRLPIYLVSLYRIAVSVTLAGGGGQRVVVSFGW